MLTTGFYRPYFHTSQCKAPYFWIRGIMVLCIQPTTVEHPPYPFHFGAILPTRLFSSFQCHATTQQEGDNRQDIQAELPFFWL